MHAAMHAAMHVRLLYLLAITTGMLLGTPAQQLLALAVAGVLLARRAVIVHGARQPTPR